MMSVPRVMVGGGGGGGKEGGNKVVKGCISEVILL